MRQSNKTWPIAVSARRDITTWIRRHLKLQSVPKSYYTPTCSNPVRAHNFINIRPGLTLWPPRLMMVFYTLCVIVTLANHCDPPCMQTGLSYSTQTETHFATVITLSQTKFHKRLRQIRHRRRRIRQIHQVMLDTRLTLLHHKKSGNKIPYLVKWQHTSRSLQPSDNITDFAINDYHIRREQRRKCRQRRSY